MGSEDVAIVGFGFSGLATLGHVVRAAREPLRVVVVAEDASGHGLAYGTRDPSHLLNVPAHDMGAWADEEDSFATWLTSANGVAARERLDARDVTDDSFAPRRLYAAYLDAIRAQTFAAAGASSVAITLVEGSAHGAVHSADGWTIDTTSGELHARSCVVATGNEQRSLFDGFEHPRLFDGPWELAAADPASWTDPVAIVGTGLTAMDAVLSLRRLGFAGELVALSRHGRLPETFALDAPAYEPDAVQLAKVTNPAGLIGLVDAGREQGHPLAEVVKGLRPSLAELWQRFSPAEQGEALDLLPARWNVARHRMSPEISEAIDRELEARTLTVTATEAIDPVAAGGELQLDIPPRGADRHRMAFAAVVDCTGPQHDWSRSRRPLLRGLVEAGLVTPHPTGLGVLADGQRIGLDLYAVGSMLTGQRFESVAVPELRGQAAAVAGEIVGRRAAATR